MEANNAHEDIFIIYLLIGTNSQSPTLSYSFPNISIKIYDTQPEIAVAMTIHCDDVEVFKLELELADVILDNQTLKGAMIQLKKNIPAEDDDVEIYKEISSIIVFTFCHHIHVCC